MIDSKDYSRSSANKEAALFFNNSSRVWRVFLVTLPLDFLILTDWFSFLRYGPLTDFAKPVALVLLAVSCILVFRDKLLPLVLSAQRLPDSESSSTAKLLVKVISFLLFGGVLVLINLVEESNFGSLLIPLVLSCAAIYSLFKSLRDAKFGSSQEEDLDVNEIHQEFGSRYVFYLDLVAIASTRCLSLTGALIACRSDYPFLVFIPYFLLALVLLLELIPKKELYVKACKGCALQTSTVFMISGFCLSCNKKRKLETGEKYRRKDRFKKISGFLEKLTKLLPESKKDIDVKLVGKETILPVSSNKKAIPTSGTSTPILSDRLK